MNKTNQGEAAVQSTENKRIVKLNRVFQFEGQEISEIDLSGLDKLTIKDLEEVQDALAASGDMPLNGVAELGVEFTIQMLKRATGKPVEMFRFAPAKVVSQLRKEVIAALNQEGIQQGKLLKFPNPIVYAGQNKEICGQTFSEVDLSEAENANTMQLKAAENKLLNKGITSSEPRNYYVCAVAAASMVTDLPEDLFEALPAKVGLALRAMMGADFFGA